MQLFGTFLLEPSKDFVGFGFGLGLAFADGLDWTLDPFFCMDSDLDLDLVWVTDWIGLWIQLF